MKIESLSSPFDVVFGTSTLQLVLIIAAVFILIAGVEYVFYKHSKRIGKQHKLLFTNPFSAFLHFNRAEWVMFIIVNGIAFALVLLATVRSGAG